ncbi:MAG: MotA/TolQ/ExbB proton channel family protein [Lentisphaerae bacterium]|jgi:biopolymer transport protein ExbB|nr:MotA/TolQ/ExbB proton channel family protein [Lentisphaerota bacterium]
MIEILVKGGSMMIPLVICSVVAVAVLIDRIWAFHANSKIDTRALRAELMTLLAENKTADAKTLCAGTPSPISAVLLVGVQAYERILEVDGSPEAIRSIMGKAMEDYSSHALSAVEKRLYILSMVGNAAPLFGMTGTVTGMIASFDALRQQGMEAGAVAAGISEALITTAAGLIIALAAVIPYNIMMTSSDNIALEIEEAASELVDFLALRAEKQRAGK